MVAKKNEETLAKFSKVSLGDAVNAAKTIGDVPTIGGIQQQMCLLMLAVGATAGKAKKFDFVFADVVNGFISTYYGEGKGVGRSKPPTETTQKNMISAYSRFGLAGMHAARPGGWDAKPLALTAIECGLNSLGARAGVVTNFMTEKGRAAAPSAKEIATHIDEKVAKQNKTKSGNAGPKVTTVSDRGHSVSALITAIGSDAGFVKFVRENNLMGRYDAMVAACTLFSQELTVALGTPKGQKGAEKVRLAAIAAAQKAQPTKGAALN